MLRIKPKQCTIAYSGKFLKLMKQADYDAWYSQAVVGNQLTDRDVFTARTDLCVPVPQDRPRGRWRLLYDDGGVGTLLRLSDHHTLVLVVPGTVRVLLVEQVIDRLQYGGVGGMGPLVLETKSTRQVLSSMWSKHSIPRLRYDILYNTLANTYIVLPYS